MQIPLTSTTNPTHKHKPTTLMLHNTTIQTQYTLRYALRIHTPCTTHAKPHCHQHSQPHNKHNPHQSPYNILPAHGPPPTNFHTIRIASLHNEVQTLHTTYSILILHNRPHYHPQWSPLTVPHLHPTTTLTSSFHANPTHKYHKPHSQAQTNHTNASQHHNTNTIYTPICTTYTHSMHYTCETTLPPTLTTTQQTQPTSITIQHFTSTWTSPYKLSHHQNSFTPQWSTNPAHYL